jgi:protein ImuB
MVRELLSIAGHLGMGLHELQAEIRTEAGRVGIALCLLTPSCEEQHLMKLVELQLERQSWSGGVIAFRLTATRLGYVPQADRSLFGDKSRAQSSKELNTLIDRLNTRLDDNAVLRPEILADAQPEHAVRFVPWKGSKSSTSIPLAFTPEHCRSRPSRLLQDPEQIDVSSVVPDGPPLRLVWQQEDRRVLRSWGPERIATGWWRAQDVERDYYRAECDDGTHVWIYREPKKGRWFLHGYFD